METTQPPQALAPLLGCPHREKASPYLQPDPLVFQLVLLPLTLALCTAVKNLAASPLSPPVSAWDVLGAPKAIPRPI